MISASLSIVASLSWFAAADATPLLIPHAVPRANALPQQLLAICGNVKSINGVPADAVADAATEIAMRLRRGFDSADNAALQSAARANNAIARTCSRIQRRDPIDADDV